jgi:hypothetical protein
MKKSPDSPIAALDFLRHKPLLSKAFLSVLDTWHLATLAPEQVFNQQMSAWRHDSVVAENVAFRLRNNMGLNFISLHD